MDKAEVAHHYFNFVNGKCLIFNLTISASLIGAGRAVGIGGMGGGMGGGMVGGISGGIGVGVGLGGMAFRRAGFNSPIQPMYEISLDDQTRCNCYRIPAVHYNYDNLQHNSCKYPSPRY